ncbi:MAG: PIN domain-containing protein, partial [Bdellovibrionia bacterium]
MILVDTSIWIEFFRKSSKVTIPVEMIPSIAVCSPVIQEVLQGIKDEGIAAKIKSSLLSFKLAGADINVDHYIEASNIYRSARRRGITIRSSIDCLIAAIAL